MTVKTFLDGKVTLHAGDCRDVLRTLPDCCIDSVVTDPPYALVSIVKRFGKPGSAPAKDGDVYSRSSSGFMGKQWDTGETAFAAEFWAEVLRVLKPGGHVVAFSGTRTYHRMACAIEDAGFEIRDQLAWTFGSGFPKSQNVAKFIDKHLGVSGTFGGPRSAAHAEMLVKGKARRGEKHEGWDRPWMDDPDAIKRSAATYEPASDEAKAFNGWGTALKPAWEPICLGRKPINGTVAENVLAYGTGALNIAGCRVEADARPLRELDAKATDSNVYVGRIGEGGLGKGLDGGSKAVGTTNLGRWPANLIHDGSDEVIAAFPDAPGQQGDLTGNEPSVPFKNVYGEMGRAPAPLARGDIGSAARFFYTAKADAEDRLGSKHPTIKPLDLMQWLVRSITPKGGVVLDPFSGTGTTGEAAWREGCRAILIEREEEYLADIARRMELAANPTKRAAVAATKNKLDDPNTLPLFAKAAE